jgi:NADH-quinone oxidoreductase subunit N
MTLNNFLLMRHELLLVLAIVIILVTEIFSSRNNINSLISFYIGVFVVVTAIGFIPMQEGQLFGGMFLTSPLHSLMKSILSIGTLIVLLLSFPWLQREQNQDKISEYFIILLATLAGMFFMISAGDFLMLYLGMELASIPLALLAAFDKMKTKSAEAGIKYIMISALSSGILLMGICYIYGTTGSIYFEDMANKLTTNNLSMLGFIFVITGLGFKISLVPFHLWTADVYEGAPTGVTAYLSVISKGSAAFVLTILLYKVFGNINGEWQLILYFLAVLTMTIGNLFALRQINIKRFLAFSSIAQAGFILLGIMGASSQGMASVVYFMLIYIFTNLAAFGIVEAVFNATGKENIDDYKGLYKTNPKLSLLMMLTMFSLAGIPPVAGFFGKFFLFTSAASKGYYILVLIAVLNATISLFYYLKVVKAMFIDKAETPLPYFKSTTALRLGLILCLAGIVLVGFLSVIYESILSISFGI